MKFRSMLGLGLVSSLVCGVTATADLQGLDYRIVANNAVAGDNNWTVEIYAVLENGSRLDAVAGDGIQDKRLAVSGGSFYQNPFGGATSTSINPALYAAFPSLQYDSWVTIGAMDQTGSPYTANNLLDIGIDWTIFEAGGSVYTDNGTWFVTPDDDQGETMIHTNQNCEDIDGVLIARVTVFDAKDIASVFMGALFQGKDDTGATWQQEAQIEFSYPTITDCNGNGVDDGCDIANGTSNDDNGNGTPDECEFTDCNDNGVADEDDIFKGTSDDCNGNGVPDECELVGGDCNENGILDECEMFDDCNDNGIPDECETFGDCNDNGIPDECEDLQDWDGNGVADICEGLVAYNVYQGIGYSDIHECTLDAMDHDVIWFSTTGDDGYINYYGKSLDITLYSTDESGVSDFSNLLMGEGSQLWSDGHIECDLTVSPFSGSAAVLANGGIETPVIVRRDAGFEFWNGVLSLPVNTYSILMQDSYIMSGHYIYADGAIDCLTGSQIWGSIILSQSGSLTGTVDLYHDMLNEGTVTALDDIFIAGYLTNDGLVAMHRGTLYVAGDLTNNGTILGEVDGGPGVRGGEGPEPGDGMKVIGNYTTGENASILMPHPNWKISVGGNFDVAINDSAMFVMNEATLKLNGHDGEQFVEVMSGDYGPTEDALNPAFGCTYPIGSLNIAAGSHVVLIDNRENDCDTAFAEVIYTESLNVAAGATLNTNGYIIYASEVDNQGTIIGEDDIIIINPPVPGDANGDGMVGILDVLVVIADWGPCDGCSGDQNGDGQASILDILLIIANWS